MDRADQRRLDLGRALGWGAGAVARSWAGAWGALLFLSLVLSAPAGLPMDGALGVVRGLLWGAAGLIALGALTRIGVADDLDGARALGLGPGGLQFGAGELRILWAAVLNLIFLSLIGCILALVALAVFGMAELDAKAIEARNWAAVGPAWKLAVLAVLSGLIIGVPLLLITRLSLFAPATIGRRRTTSLNAMGVGYGSFWPLFALLLLILASLGAIVWTAGRMETPWCWLAVVIAVPWLWAPFSAGALAGAYRQLEYWTPDGA